MTALNKVLPDLQEIVESLWEQRQNLIVNSDSKTLQPIYTVLEALDTGKLRTALYDGRDWVVQEWIKKAILLYFKVQCNILIQEENFIYFDKVPLKFKAWKSEDFKAIGLRVVPGAVVRFGAYLGERVVVMPSFVNTGSYVGSGTMIDSYVTVGSCAQIGENCHLSANVLIGGVLEPLQSAPVIVEDDCFIGAGSQIVEGVRICRGSVIGMGVNLGASTPILDRETSAISYGVVPPYSVLIPGMMESDKGDVKVQLPCAVIVKTVDAQTRSKTSLNDLLRPK